MFRLMGQRRQQLGVTCMSNAGVIQQKNRTSRVVPVLDLEDGESSSEISCSQVPLIP